MHATSLEQAFHEFGHDALAVAALDRPYRVFCREPGAALAFAGVRKARVAIGSPLAAVDRWPSIADDFVAEARGVGERVSFFGVERPEHFGPDYRSVLIGQQPAWTPSDWAAIVDAHATLREQIRRARAKGVIIESVDPAELRSNAQRRGDWEELVRDWLGTRRMAPMQFVVRPRGLDSPDDRRFFTAECDGRLVGFLCTSRLPLRSSEAIGDVFRDRHAPNGTVELLHDVAIRHAAESGAKSVSAGLVPLAGPVHPTLRAARTLGRPLFDFRGLQTFRSRLRPQRWEPVYLVHPAEESSVRAVLDVLRAFAGGSLLRFGIQTLGHRVRREGRSTQDPVG